MTLAVNPSEGAGVSGGSSVRFPRARCIHSALMASIAITLATGMFHLLNLVGTGRAGFGPTLITFFRASFAISWILLLFLWIWERRLPRFEVADWLMALLAAIFIFRGALTPETFSITFNWVLTGAGVYYLVRFATRGKGDVRLVLATIAGAALIIAVFGLFEYIFKSNPLFDSIQIDVIGIDARTAASDQFYRIRSLVGHPSFVGAMLLGSMPVVMLVCWKRRWLLATSLALLTMGLFLTFSRGSWIIGTLLVLPVVTFRARDWLRRNLKWVAPLAILPVLVVAFDYINREEVSAEFSPTVNEQGLHWVQADGPVARASGEADGILPYTRFVYFDVSDSFYYGGGKGPVTIVISYFDRGHGALRIDYDSMGNGSETDDVIYTPTASIIKTDTHQWTSAAFFLNNPSFQNRMNDHTDFRIVDDDTYFILKDVVVQKGRLKLPGVIAQQWMSRASSLSTRASLFPAAWAVLEDNPLGVGLFNSPGTDHHAVDSLPLTWMMEFGWPGLLLIGGLILLLVNEVRHAYLDPRAPAAILLLSMIVLVLHGSHLMILYDKPSLVLMSAITAVYVNIRPWRRGAPHIGLSKQDCML